MAKKPTPREFAEDMRIDPNMGMNPEWRKANPKKAPAIKLDVSKGKIVKKK